MGDGKTCNCEGASGIRFECLMGILGSTLGLSNEQLVSYEPDVREIITLAESAGVETRNLVKLANRTAKRHCDGASRKTTWAELATACIADIKHHYMPLNDRKEAMAHP